MNRLTRTMLSALLGSALLLQLGGAALADDDKPKAPDDQTAVQLLLRAPVCEKDKEGKETPKLDAEGRPVFEDVADTEKAFGKDSGLTISVKGRPEKKPAATPSPTESPAPSEQPKETETPVLSCTVSDLRKNGLYVMPPKGYFVQSLTLVDPEPPTESPAPTESPKKDASEALNLTTLAEAEADSAAVFVPKAVFAADYKNEELKEPVFPADAKSFTLRVVFGRLDEKAELTLSYQPGDFETDKALFDTDEIKPEGSHKLLALSEDTLKEAEEQGLHFAGWLLEYATQSGARSLFPANGSSLLLQPGDEISPYMSCRIEAQWTVDETRNETEPTPDPTAEPEPEATPEPTEEPAPEETPEPTAEPVTEPTPEPTLEPTPEPTTEPTPEPTEEPVIEPTPEPTAEPTPEPTAEPVIEPTPAPTTEPTPEPTPAPTAEPTPAPTPEPLTLHITLKSGTATERVYDGTSFRLVPDDFTVSGLPENAACELELQCASEPVKAGESAEYTVSVKSLNVGGKAMAASDYRCDPLKLTIRVTQRELNVSAAAEKVYDGTPLTLSNAASVTYSSGSGELVSGHRIASGSCTAELTDAGSASTVLDAASVKVLDASGADVSANYRVIAGTATLTVTRRPLMIRTSSAVKLYDGTPLTDHTAPTVTGLLSGHRLPITFTGKQEKVGSSANSIKTDFKITANDKDVTKNYDISYSFGTLTVLRASDTTYIKGTKQDMTLRLDVDYSDFRDLLMDGAVLGSENYTSSSGSTVVTLKGSYLETLKTGQHSLTVRFKDANDIKLTVNVKLSSDKDDGIVRTGDDSRIGLFIGLGAASLLLIVVVLILLKKLPKDGGTQKNGKHGKH